MNTKYTAFRCPENILAAAKQRAKAERRSLSNYIICILEEQLAGDLKPKSKAGKDKKG